MPKFLDRITAQEFSSAASAAIDASVDGDTNARIQIDAGGKVTWGSGAAAGDVNLYRDAADALKTDDTLEAASGLITSTSAGAPTATIADGALAVDTTNDAFYFRSGSSWNQVTGGGGSITTSDTAPVSPDDGDLWYETDTGRTLVYYADGTSSQWVEVGASASVTNNAITTSDAAPSSPSVGDIWFESDTGDLFTYYDGVWVEVGQATDTANLGLSDADGDTLIQVEESADEDTIRFDTAGTERMVIKPDGKVGIGTATPLEQVEIAGVNDRTALRLSGAGGSGSVTGKVYLGMHQWASGANPSVRIGAEEITVSNYDADLVFQTRDSGSDVLPTTRMTIDHTGKVGIGTTTPANTLHVKKDVDDFVVKIENDGDSTSSDGLWLDTRWNTATNTVLKVTSNSGTSDFFYIKGDGKVGIGTATPSSTLHISDATDRTPDANGDGHVRVNGDGYSGFISLDASSMWVGHNSTSRNLVFATDETERMTIAADGKVGVGTTSPAAKLHVAGGDIFSEGGNIQTGQGSFTQQPWADATIALGHFGSVGTQGSHRTSLAWNWDRGPDSAYYSLGANGYTSAAAIELGNDGILFRMDSSYGATAPPTKRFQIQSDGVLNISSGSYISGYLYGTATSAGAGWTVVGSSGVGIGFMGSPGNDDMHIWSTATSGYMYFKVGNDYRCYSTSVGGWYPYVDNSYNLGYSSKRWNDVWATNGTIQTSDVNLKKDIVDTSLGLAFVNALRPVEYKWIDGSRKHQGFIAQEVEVVLDAQDTAADQAMWGLNTIRDGLTHTEPIEDEDGIPQKVEVPTIPTQSLRYNEFIAPLVKAVQELSARIETLEAP